MILGLLGVASAAAALWVTWLLFDGSRALLKRRRMEARRHAGRTPLRLVVKTRADHTADLFELVLAHPDGRRLPRFRPGQFLTLRVPAEEGGNLISRRYSLSAWTARPREYRLGIRRAGDGRVSGWLHRHAFPGGELEVLPPAGEFVLQGGHGEVVLVGGGIGITPMAAMVDALAARPSLAGSVWLFHSARTEEELVGRARFEELERRAHWFHYRPLLSQPGHGWERGTGRLAAIDLVGELADPERAAFYFCARQEMMDGLAYGLAALEVPAESIHWESFGGLQGGLDDAEYQIGIEGYGGHVFRSQPSLLHALEEWGVPVRAECRAGECGACRMRLKRGEIRNRMQPAGVLASQLGQGEFLACCAVPASDLEVVF